MFHNFWKMFHLPPIYPKIRGFKIWSDFFLKPLRMLYKHFPTHDKVFKVQDVPFFLGMLDLPPIYLQFPPIFPKLSDFKMWSNFFLKPPKCLIDTSLHIIKCLKCKMFHTFWKMFHLPPIYPEIRGFKMWSDFFFLKSLKMLYKHFPTHSQVFKVQNVP
jgi:hypothetical protein